MFKRLILIRGCSGSGKTTYANELIETIQNSNEKVKHFEADQYFIKDGEYCFNPKKLPEAHKFCMENTIKALNDDETDVVIVSNTFCRKWEIEPYIKLAEENENITLAIYRLISQFVNVHGVSIEKIEKQKNSMEDINGEIIMG